MLLLKMQAIVSDFFFTECHNHTIQSNQWIWSRFHHVTCTSYGLFECAYYAFDFRVKCMIIWEIGYVFVFICLTMEKSASYRDEVAVLVLLSGSVTLFNTCSVQRYISRSGFQFHHNYTPLNIHTIDATFSN